MARIHARPCLSHDSPDLQPEWVEGSFRRILVLLDGSPTSWRALRMGISLAWQHDAELCALSVQAGPPRYPATVGEVQAETEREEAFHRNLQSVACQMAALRGVTLQCTTITGQFVDATLRFVRNGRFDLFVLPAGGDGLWERLTGPTVRLSQSAPCSVMVVR